jgi:hypothetical protein
MLPPIPLAGGGFKYLDLRKYQQSPTSLVQALNTYNTGNILIENKSKNDNKKRSKELMSLSKS